VANPAGIGGGRNRKFASKLSERRASGLCYLCDTPSERFYCEEHRNKHNLKERAKRAAIKLAAQVFMRKARHG
jgi:hypothetical protein